ncbi:hypothetical protein M440DRAFT_1055037 [Trichoderma longibrachiatum ATCC 18648]|uniref:Uncharacterized protein n=1 Tax=Trichoderma longibrachiatum ATCC 18648 TaxID=983965 RepID=A0A2T4BX27_TRILO|nr:hypothetical protein M440DRAFT_1055037 [Trichoderma longibrachiatum ATCC 18648]
MFRPRIRNRLLQRYESQLSRQIMTRRGFSTNRSLHKGQGKEADGEALRTAERRAEEARAAEERREYKRRYDGAARRWVSTIIALPILLVTSYYLFDRLVLGKKPKSLEKYRGEKAD